MSNYVVVSSTNNSVTVVNQDRTIVVRDSVVSGPRGPAGSNGVSPTITVGNVVTGAEGSNVTITNVGNSTNVVLDFSIPRGNTGNGVANLLSVTTDIIPSVNNAYNIGSAANQWNSLYVSSNTIYIGNIPLTIDANGTLIVNNVSVSNGVADAYEQANTALLEAYAAHASANAAANTVQISQNSIGTLYGKHLNFVNTATVTVNISADLAGNANIEFNTLNVDSSNAYNQANAARLQANTARDTANSAFDQANGAHNQANTARDTANSAFDQANGAHNQANTARGQANAAYGQANAAYGQANAAYGQANIARTTANDAYAQANAVNLLSGGTVTGQLNLTGSGVSLNVANDVFFAGNVAIGRRVENFPLYIERDSLGVTSVFIVEDGTLNPRLVVYGNNQGSVIQHTYSANASNLLFSIGGALGDGVEAMRITENRNVGIGETNPTTRLHVNGSATFSEDVFVNGSIYLQGNASYINVATLNISDPLIYLASNNEISDIVDIGFMGGKNTAGIYSHTGLARDATDGKWKLFDGLPEEDHTENLINFANTYLATLVANVEANSITLMGNVVATEANLTLAYDQANAAYAAANAANGGGIGYVLVTANTGSQVNSGNINFINTSTVTVSVVSGDNGNANVSFTSVGGLPLANGTSSIDIPIADGYISVIANAFTWTFNETNGLLELAGNLANFSACSAIDFVANSSGDGNGYSTIELRPDSNATNDQYLIIDPTAPNHIHIRAGGVQDNSNAEIYLGGENSYFKVDNGENPSTEIASNNYYWTFNTDGTIIFPDSTVQNTAFVGYDIINTKQVFESTSPLSVAAGTVTHDCSKGHIFVHSSINANFTPNFANVTISPNNATSFTLVLNQGATAFVPTAVQIEGQAQTVYWQGSATAPGGNANKKDVVSFSVVNNNGTWITLGQLTSFG